MEAIGNTFNNNSVAKNNVVSQDDFIKLFLAQLSFQDPMEPVNNEQFLAQMAQFANLEQTRLIHESLEQQTFMTASQQALGLLGKTVNVATSTGQLSGKVSAVNFNQNGALLTVTQANDSFISDVKLSQITLVTE